MQLPTLDEIDRELARRRLLNFTTYTMPGYSVNWHHELVCSYLDRFAVGDIKRLMIFQPPRTGKSELVSRRLPAFMMGRNPDLTIIAASYGADLARRMNRDVQRIIDSKPYRDIFPATTLSGKNIRADAQGTWLRNSDMFEVVGRAGYYMGTGVGGAVTGMGCHVAIIDDPVKNRKEANSPTYQKSVFDWYTSTLYTRLTPDGQVLLTVTRWHEMDLAGRLLALANSDSEADQWTVITLPAIAEEPVAPYDCRQPGEALWSERWGVDKMRKVQKTIGSYDWAALYQQRPAPREGGMFKRDWFEIVGAAPKAAKRVRYWDKAGSTSKGSDYTAGVLLAKDSDGVFYVEDVVWGQFSALERNRVIKQTAARDAALYGMIPTWLEQEPGSGGKESAENSVRDLAGYNVHTETVSGDKETRATPFSAQCEARNVKLVAGLWNGGYLDELTGFPNAAHDDRVDGSSGSFNKLAVTIGDLVGFA